jgi:hypothetical protein
LGSLLAHLLQQVLGIAPPPRQLAGSRTLHNAKRDVVYHQNNHKLNAFIPLVRRSTQSGTLYIYLGEVNVIPIKVIPIPISKVDNDMVVVNGGEPLLSCLQTIKPMFWESLQLGGGGWMWDYVSGRILELYWLKTALEQGTVILATDGSYSWTKGPHISGTGWIIVCQRSWKMLQGSFYEISSDASRYQGELLGLVALCRV